MGIYTPADLCWPCLCPHLSPISSQISSPAPAGLITHNFTLFRSKTRCIKSQAKTTHYIHKNWPSAFPETRTWEIFCSRALLFSIVSYRAGSAARGEAGEVRGQPGSDRLISRWEIRQKNLIPSRQEAPVLDYIQRIFQNCVIFGVGFIILSCSPPPPCVTCLLMRLSRAESRGECPLAPPAPGGDGDTGEHRVCSCLQLTYHDENWYFRILNYSQGPRGGLIIGVYIRC